MKPLRTHPAVVLVFVSALLFAVNAAWAPAERKIIRVTGEMLEQIAESRAELIGRPLTQDERDSAVDAFIEDEVLVREAFRQGIDRSDRRVRQFLISEAQFDLLGRDIEAPEPTSEETREYFDAHRDDYSQREAATIDYLYFAPGALPRSPEAILAELDAGADPATIARSVGEYGRAANLTRRAISGVQGREFADQVMALETGRWGGPLRTPRGTYFNRIVERRAGRELSFDEVRDRVARDWEASWYRAQLQESLAELRGRYDIEVQDGGLER